MIDSSQRLLKLVVFNSVDLNYTEDYVYKSALPQAFHFQTILFQV